MVEKIHNISLDLTNYSGKDLYSDGAIEDEMLSLVKQHDENELNGIIRERFGWPLLYHFSQIRQNIVTWLPITKEQNVLEVGAGCGAITGGLARMAGKVTCIELSKKRSMINANRNKAYDNIDIKVGNFTDIEPTLTEKYDYITLIGVFEYAECYIQSEDPYIDFLNRIKRHLKPDGKIVIAIENRIGMKYIAGCKEDHTARIGEGLDHYPNTSGVKTYDKAELCSIMQKAGFTDYEFFYPYPDYKLPLEIYSDSYLPQKGSLSQNINNLDQQRMYFFDESDAFDKALELGIFDEVSNSFEIILKNPEQDKSLEIPADDHLQVEYARFSNDRGAEYAIQTQILRDSQGHRYVRKVPDTFRAQAHVDRICHNEELLASVYKDTRFVPNHVIGKDNMSLFEFVEGTTLEKELDCYLSAGRKQEFYALFDSFIEELKKVSGDYYNIDFIPANIIVHDGYWHVIDYEWIYPKDQLPVAGMDIDFLVYRAIHYYMGVSKLRHDLLREDELYRHFGIGDTDRERFAQIEKDFQCALDGDYYKLMTAKNDHHKSIVDVNQAMAEYQEKQWELLIRFYDQDKAMLEEMHMTVPEYMQHMVCVSLPLYGSVREVEISRTGNACIYGMEHAYYKDAEGEKEIESCYAKGVLIGHEQIYLKSADALVLQLDGQDQSGNKAVLTVHLRETPMSADIAHVVELKDAEISQQNMYIEGLKENIRLLEEAIHTMENSSSWKVTKPLRSVSRIMRGEKND